MICQKHPFWQQLNLTAFTWLDKSTILFVIRVDVQQQQTTQIDFNYASINNIRSIVRFRKPDVVITKIYMAQTSLIQIAIQLLVFMHLDLSSVYLWWNPIEIILNTYLDQTHKLADGIYIIILRVLSFMSFWFLYCSLYWQLLEILSFIIF